MCDCKQIIVKKTVWVRTEVSHLYDEYELTYVSVERVKSGLYRFKLINKIKKNKEPFGGGGCVHIVYPYEIETYKLLRKHKIRWNVKNFTWAGRVVRWFNVKHPCWDEDYIQTPTELYPIYGRDDSPTGLKYSQIL